MKLIEASWIERLIEVQENTITQYKKFSEESDDGRYFDGLISATEGFIDQLKHSITEEHLIDIEERAKEYMPFCRPVREGEYWGDYWEIYDNAFEAGAKAAFEVAGKTPYGYKYWKKQTEEKEGKEIVDG